MNITSRQLDDEARTAPRLVLMALALSLTQRKEEVAMHVDGCDTSILHHYFVS
jgi:hypothetical protein